MNSRCWSLLFIAVSTTSLPPISSSLPVTFLSSNPNPISLLSSQQPIPMNELESTINWPPRSPIPLPQNNLSEMLQQSPLSARSLPLDSNQIGQTLQLNEDGTLLAPHLQPIPLDQIDNSSNSPNDKNKALMLLMPNGQLLLTDLNVDQCEQLNFQVSLFNFHCLIR